MSILEELQDSQQQSLTLPGDSPSCLASPLCDGVCSVHLIRLGPRSDLLVTVRRMHTESSVGRVTNMKDRFRTGVIGRVFNGLRCRLKQVSLPVGFDCLPSHTALLFSQSMI